MYVSRIVYDGCCSFQDANSRCSSLPDSLFNLTQSYYYLLPNNEIDVICDAANNVSDGCNQSRL